MGIMGVLEDKVIWRNTITFPNQSWMNSFITKPALTEMLRESTFDKLKKKLGHLHGSIYDIDYINGDRVP